MGKLKRALVASVIVIGALVATELVVAGPAEAAAGTILCQGYSSCESLGMTTHGYPAKSSTEYWKMVAGHNCTNYAAYMMVQAGMANVRPWTGDGNATGWGPGNAQSVDQTPTVGSIAWWSANQHGAGSAGHVAYVEQVTATSIITSEDNYGGDFYYRVIKRTDTTWPSGFIHLKDATTSASFPAFRGRPLAQTAYTDASKAQAVQLTAMKPGSTAWITLTFQNTGNSDWNGTRIVTAGATSAVSSAAWAAPNTPVAQKQAAVITGGTATFSFPVVIPAVPDGTQFPETFTVVQADGSPISYAAAQVVFTADSRVPFTTAPITTVGGVAKQGSTLSAVAGVWAPVQPTLTFQWLREGKAITGATTPTYKPTATDVGRHLSLVTTASAPGYLPVTQTSAVPTTITSVYGNRLAKKKTFKVAAQIVSSNGQYRLTQSAKGNLAVVNRFTSKVVWSSKAHASKAYTRLRSDGVLVTYSKTGKPIWNSKTKGKKISYALVTNSGKLALYTASGKAVWTSAKK